MAIDRTTETIAHFVGLFALSVEKMIQREQYSEFRATQNARDDLDAINALPFQVNTDYRLKEYDPKLKYTPSPAGSTGSQAATAGETVIPPNTVANMPFDGPTSVGPIPVQVSSTTTFVTNFTLAIPSSLVSVNLQFNTLSDNDTIGVDADQMFIPTAYFEAMLEQIVEIAESLQGFSMPILPSAEDGWQSFAGDLLDQIAAPETEAAATVGITINGESADEVPELEGLLPAFLQDDELQDVVAEEEDNATDADDGDATLLTGDDMDTTVSTQSGDSGSNDVFADNETLSVASDDDAVQELPNIDDAFPDSDPDSEWEVEDGHLIVAGANTQLNQTQVASSWLDADVIAVQGDVYDVDAISQVNVMVGADVVDGQLTDAISTALNIVEIIETSSDAPAEDEIAATDIDDDLELMSYEGLPTDSVVVRINTDVAQINWTVQESYLNDHDSATVTIAASATYIGLGDNDEFNQTFLTETGFNYDLILVGGDLVDVNLVTQTNVLLDGGTIDTNGMGDLVNVVGGDNLQFNLAQINTVGIDTEAELEADFGDALIALADGAEEVGSAVENNELFDGTEVLSVLYIEGDLTTVNVVVQNNILGDVDQLNVAHAALEAAQNLDGLAASIAADVEAEVEIVTGSNMQANIAALNDFGTDSTVMAGGDFYSDALIHQAEFIDTDALPNGVELSGLVSEAVAFLADDLVADLSTLGDDIMANTHASMNDMPGTADIMQSVLS